MKIKIYAAALAAAVCMASFTACGSISSDSSDGPSVKVSDSTAKNDKSEDEASDDSGSKKAIAESDGYSVYIEYFEENIGYPQIEGLNDTAVMEKVNDYLKDLEYSRYEKYDAEKNYETSAEVSYCSDSVLSLTQYAFFNGGSLETGGYSMTPVNLNMETGEELNIADIADVNALAEKFFTGEGVVITDGYEGASIADFIEQDYIASKEDMYEYISKAMFTIDADFHIIVRFPTGEGPICAYAE